MALEKPNLPKFAQILARMAKVYGKNICVILNIIKYNSASIENMFFKYSKLCRRSNMGHQYLVETHRQVMQGSIKNGLT